MADHTEHHKRLASKICGEVFYNLNEAKRALTNFLQNIIRDLCGKSHKSDIPDVFAHMILNSCALPPRPNTNLVVAIIFFLQNETINGKTAIDLLKEYADNINTGTAFNHVKDLDRVDAMLEADKVANDTKTPEKIMEETKHTNKIEELRKKMQDKKKKLGIASAEEIKSKPKIERDVSHNSHIHDLMNNRVSFASRDELKPEMAWIFDDHFKNVTFESVANILYQRGEIEYCKTKLNNDVVTQELFKSVFDLKDRLKKNIGNEVQLNLEHAKATRERNEKLDKEAKKIKEQYKM